MSDYAARLISSALLVCTGCVTFGFSSLSNRDEGMTMGFCVLGVGAYLFLTTWRDGNETNF